MGVSMSTAFFKGLILPLVVLSVIISACPNPSGSDLERAYPSPSPEAPDPDLPQNDVIFNLEDLPAITLDLGASEWGKFLAYYDFNENHEELVEARFEINRAGEAFVIERVGLGLRGNTSRRRPEESDTRLHDPISPIWRHAHFKLDFNAILPGQEYLGVDKLNLKWFKGDGTRTREIYCYDLLRRFGVLTAPRASYAHLKLRIRESDGRLTEVPYGLYEMVEAVDNDYLAARTQSGLFSSSEGFLFKCLIAEGQDGEEHVADLVENPGLAEWIGVESINLDENFSLRYTYDLKTRKNELAAAKEALISFIHDLNSLSDDEFPSWISGRMDIDLFLKTLAVDSATGSWDDYWHGCNNYYLYIQPDGKVFYIPYDYDNSLGVCKDNENFGTRSAINWGFNNNRPLALRILGIPAYLERYREIMRELMDPARGLFDPDASVPRILAWRNFIQDAVTDDLTEADSHDFCWDVDWEIDAPGYLSLEDVASYPPYRLLGGDANHEGENPNFFMVRRTFILSTLSQALNH